MFAISLLLAVTSAAPTSDSDLKSKCASSYPKRNTASSIGKTPGTLKKLETYHKVKRDKARTQELAALYHASEPDSIADRPVETEEDTTTPSRKRQREEAGSYQLTVLSDSATVKDIWQEWFVH
jgi:hypothetical protein